MEQNNPRQEQTQGQQQTNQTDAGQLGQNQSQIQNPKTPGNGPFNTGGATNDPNPNRQQPGTNEEDNFRDDQNSDPSRQYGEVMEPNEGNPYAPSDPGSPRDPAMNPPFGGEDMDESNMDPMPREPMN